MGASVAASPAAGRSPPSASLRYRGQVSVSIASVMRSAVERTDAPASGSAGGLLSRRLDADLSRREKAQRRALAVALHEPVGAWLERVYRRPASDKSRAELRDRLRILFAGDLAGDRPDHRRG